MSNSIFRNYIFSLLSLCLNSVIIIAQPIYNVKHYDENDGLSHSHITQLFQDDDGFMWFATWNGLCRFDGYEFCTFKPKAGDGCYMLSDRIRNVVPCPNNKFLCRSDDNYFFFSTSDYTFHDAYFENTISPNKLMVRYRRSSALRQNDEMKWTDKHGTQWILKGNGILMHNNEPKEYLQLNDITFYCFDKQDNLWIIGQKGIYQITTSIQCTQRIEQQGQSQVKCLFTDNNGRIWITNKEDATIRIYSDNNILLGYLGSDGQLHHNYTSFGSSIYCICQTADNTFWLGSKPDGLFCLQEHDNLSFSIKHIDNLSNKDVYCIKKDSSGRMWIATLGDGLFYSTDQTTFIRHQHYPTHIAQKVRYLHIIGDSIITVATTDGFVVAKLSADANQMHFHLHQREANRNESLSSSATTDIAEHNKKLYISTESGGINETNISHILDSTICFNHIGTESHQLNSDVILSVTPIDEEHLMTIGSTTISIIDNNGLVQNIDANRLNAQYHFSEAHPLKTADGHWAFGVTDGAFTTTIEQLLSDNYSPELVLTSISVQGGNNKYSVQHTDTIVLSPSERNLTIRFAAIDYNAKNQIRYAYKILPDSNWNYLGTDHSVTLLDLEPGTYQLELRSTDATCKWLNNNKLISIVVEPKFWESVLGHIIITLIFVVSFSIIIGTIIYIRKIKQQQRETLNAYLSVLNKQQNNTKFTHNLPPTDDAMIKRIMTFIEQNISNSEINIGDMASAAATSRTSLQRKLKQTMGITPQDLMREARIKHACLLLQTTNKTITEITFDCGFTDPKYFSKCFKTSVGRTPSEYREDWQG